MITIFKKIFKKCKNSIIKFKEKEQELDKLRKQSRQTLKKA